MIHQGQILPVCTEGGEGKPNNLKNVQNAINNNRVLWLLYKSDKILINSKKTIDKQ